jgi:hypothetical protein
MLKTVMAAGAVVCLSWGSAWAQVSSAEAERIKMRQQLATMEGVLERAIVSGAQNVIVQVRRVIPERPRLGQSRISGFRLDGHGVVFHVDVPMFRLPITYQMALLDMQTRNALMRIQQLRTQSLEMPPGPERNELQAHINQLEQELALGNFRPTEPNRGMIGAASLVPAAAPRPAEREPTVIEDPEGAYTREVMAALVDAMLTNSQALGVKSDEWLTIVARDGVPNDPQFPGDAIGATIQVMSVRGSTLAAFQSRAMTLEEARKQVEVKEQ